MERSTNLFSYVIDHIGDPNNERAPLVLGVNDCKRTMRPHVEKGDWVIATLGKNFTVKKNRFSDTLKEDYPKYLVYAMKVTEPRDENNRLTSADFFGFFDMPIKLDAPFHKFIKKGPCYKRFPHKGKEAEENKLIANFEAWLRRRYTENWKIGPRQVCSD